MGRQAVILCGGFGTRLSHVVSDVDTIAKEVLLLGKGRIKNAGSINELCHTLDGKVYELNVKLKGCEVTRLKASPIARKRLVIPSEYTVPMCNAKRRTMISPAPIIIISIVISFSIPGFTLIFPLLFLAIKNSFPKRSSLESMLVQ